MEVVWAHRAVGVVSIVSRGTPLVRGISCAGCSQVRWVGTVQRPVGARQETGAFTPPSFRPFPEGLSRREGTGTVRGVGCGVALRSVSCSRSEADCGAVPWLVTERPRSVAESEGG